MNRLSARAGSALLALIAAAAALLPVSARADESADMWFAGTRLIFEHATANGPEVAVPVSDAGLARFLGRVGATLSWDTTQRNIIVVAADRRVIRFTLGDVHYSVANAEQSAAFAPYVLDGQAYVPFMQSLARWASSPSAIRAT